jgi:hypothetical protein
MNNSFLKIGAIAGFLGLLLSIVALVGVNQPAQFIYKDANVGGYTDGTWDSNGGVLVDGTTIISGSGALSIGGTAVNSVSYLTSGTCNLWVGGNTTIAASTTVAFDCQSGTLAAAALSDVPQWQSGDQVFLTAPTTTTQTFLGLDINAVSGSSTAGYIRVQITNKTGGTFTIASSSQNAYQYLYMR